MPRKRSEWHLSGFPSPCVNSPPPRGWRLISTIRSMIVFYFLLAVQEQYPVVTADTRFHEKVRGHPYLSDRITDMATLE